MQVFMQSCYQIPFKVKKQRHENNFISNKSNEAVRGSKQTYREKHCYTYMKFYSFVPFREPLTGFLLASLTAALLPAALVTAAGFVGFVGVALTAFSFD